MQLKNFVSSKSLVRVASVAVVLQAAMWAGSLVGARSAHQAQAALPSNNDPASWRQEMIEQLKALNEKLDRVANLMESGKLQVASEPSK